MSTYSKTIDFRLLKFSGEPLPYLKAGVCFPGKTIDNSMLYLQDYISGNCVRTNAIETCLVESVNADDFIARLMETWQGLAMLMQRHKKIIVTMAGMPRWISSSSDTTPVYDTHWVQANTVSPGNILYWVALVREIAKFFQYFKSIPCQVYFEFWNEPDLNYWQDSDANLYALYQVTAKTIKDIEPTFKVGGYAVNQVMADDLLKTLYSSAQLDGVPLDFVSWHNYTNTSGYIETAVKYLNTPLEKVISEWNVRTANRASATAKPLFFDLIQQIMEQKVTHTICAWEDYHPGGAIDDYGLLTQNAQKKPIFHAFNACYKAAETAGGVNSSRDLFIFKGASDYLFMAWAGNETLQFDFRQKVAVKECMEIENGASVQWNLTSQRLRIQKSASDVIQFRVVTV